MNKIRLKKGDNVMVISGKDRGKQGVIEKVFPGENKILVIGVNISKHHLKPSRKNPQGGIVNKIAPINCANVMMICPSCGKPTRIGYKISEKQGGKIRICRKCQGSLDVKQ